VQIEYEGTEGAQTKNVPISLIVLSVVATVLANVTVSTALAYVTLNELIGLGLDFWQIVGAGVLVWWVKA
jgi:hypothetical protein